jgi:hypothetical protein
MYKVIGSDQQVYGPVTIEQLRQWLAEGRVIPSTLVQAEGAKDWKPLSSLPDFATPPVVSMPPAPARAESDGMAMAALICGILSNLCSCFGLVFVILGLIFSLIVLNRPEGGPGQKERPMALAGLILSLIGLLWHGLLPALFGWPGAWRFHHYRWWRP